MACRGIYRKPCRCYFLNSVPAFHGIALCSRNNIIRCNIHGSGKGSGIIVSIKFPPAIVYPMSALITVIAPIPVRKPVGVPDTPCCRCILRIRGDGWNGKTRIRIRGSGIRRNIFIQIHNICDEAGFAVVALWRDALIVIRQGSEGVCHLTQTIWEPPSGITMLFTV